MRTLKTELAKVEFALELAEVEFALELALESSVINQDQSAPPVELVLWSRASKIFVILLASYPSAGPPGTPWTKFASILDSMFVSNLYGPPVNAALVEQQNPTMTPPRPIRPDTPVPGHR